MTSKTLSTGALQLLQPIVLELQRFIKVAAPRLLEAAPIVLEVMSEFKKWNISSDVLGKAGWLPHYTTPFEDIIEWSEDEEAVRNRLLNYYKDNWQNVRLEIEARLSNYKIDEEAKATFREALDAHEAGLYRCVCRVLFPEIERVFRVELFNNEIGPLSYEKLVKKLLEDKYLEDFTPGGIYDLSAFGHLTKAVRKGSTSESDKSIFGLFTKVENEEHRERLKQNLVPNRHAAIHGLVVYSSPQNSLNTIFIADYVFQIFTRAMSLPSYRQ